MAVLKGVVSINRAGEEKPIERYKTRHKVQEEHRSFSAFRKNVIDFLGLNDQAKKFALAGSFDFKFYRLAKISGKTENYSISTKGQSRTQSPQAPWSAVWSPGDTLGKWNFFSAIPVIVRMLSFIKTEVNLSREVGMLDESLDGNQKS